MASLAWIANSKCGSDGRFWNAIYRKRWDFGKAFESKLGNLYRLLQRLPQSTNRYARQWKSRVTPWRRSILAMRLTTTATCLSLLNWTHSVASWIRYRDFSLLRTTHAFGKQQQANYANVQVTANASVSSSFELICIFTWATDSRVRKCQILNWNQRSLELKSKTT